MVDENVEHLGVMAYAASFQWIPPRTHPSSLLIASYKSHTARVYQPVRISILPREIWTSAGYYFSIKITDVKDSFSPFIGYHRFRIQ